MTDKEWTRIKYFEGREFDDPTAPGSGAAMMDWAFVSRLDALRRIWGRPLLINSGYRSLEHNISVGGVKDSAHMRGLAADIRCDGITDCIRLVLFSALNGFNRFGIDLNGHYIHLDCDMSLPSPAVWFYNVPK